jgi:hypothetical protein
MEIEIYLDVTRADAGNYPIIEERLVKWHAERAEIRYEKACFGQMREIEKYKRYHVDLGRVDPVTAIRELHASLYRFGAKVYIHFVP